MNYTKKDRLQELEERILGCTKCLLSQFRNRAVPGEGNPGAELVIIGQGPGKNEDATGRPFVGRAGDLLNDCMEKVGIERSEVWITNVTRCLPPDNRLPSPEEIKTCVPYLLEQINIIKPKIISPLGNIALKVFWGKSAKIIEFRGKLIPQRDYFIFPMIHPAAALRRPDYLPQVLEDFLRLKESIDSPPELISPPGQESLF